MREFMAAAKALADPTRVRLLLALEAGELCVCQLVEFADLAPSTVSKHLSILRQAQLVEARKDGRWIYYRLPENGVPLAVRGALDWVCASAKSDAQARRDRIRVKEIRKLDTEELCRKQGCR